MIKTKFKNNPLFKKINYMYNNGAITIKNYFKILENEGFLYSNQNKNELKNDKNNI